MENTHTCAARIASVTCQHESPNSCSKWGQTEILHKTANSIRLDFIMLLRYKNLLSIHLLQGRHILVKQIP